MVISGLLSYHVLTTGLRNGTSFNKLSPTLCVGVYGWSVRDQESLWLKVWALITITFISLLIGLAVLRTHLLVMKALKQIKEDNTHPYTRFSKSIRCFPVNANSVLLAVPFTLTAFFLGTTIYYCVFPSADSVDTSTTLSPPSTVYRIEDNSDHCIMIAAPGKSPSVSSPAPLSHRKRKAR